MAEEFDPKIIGFLCNWCSYAGADLAGVSRIQYPPNIRTIRVMCSGRIDPVLVVEALINGIDGVIVTGCHIGDCHYLTGNNYAEDRITALKEALGRTSIDADRVRLEWVSASEGKRFGDVATEFIDQIRNLGPNPALEKDEKGSELLKELQAVKSLMEEYRMRILVGKQFDLVNKGNVYDDKIESDEYKKLVDDCITNDYIDNYILASIIEEPKSVKELSEELKKKPQEILSHLSVLRRDNRVTLERIDDTTPKYRSVSWEDDA